MENEALLLNGVDGNDTLGLVETLKSYMIEFPQMRDIPLYDFHFNKIEEDPSVLEGRAFYSDTFNTDFH